MAEEARNPLSRSTFEGCSVMFVCRSATKIVSIVTVNASGNKDDDMGWQ